MLPSHFPVLSRGPVVAAALLFLSSVCSVRSMYPLLSDCGSTFSCEDSGTWRCWHRRDLAPPSPACAPESCLRPRVLPAPGRAPPGAACVGVWMGALLCQRRCPSALTGCGVQHSPLALQGLRLGSTRLKVTENPARPASTVKTLGWPR